MCIVCNLEIGEGDQLLANNNLASEFLHSWDQSVAAMRRTQDAMLAASKAVEDPDVRKRYDRIHKAMVRIRKEWCKLEHERERGAPTKHGQDMANIQEPDK